jgi:drug/metabolite transporter (DMT)-like permease
MRLHRTRARILLLATALVWGATFVLVKAALSDASPLLFNLLRMTLAALLLAAIHRDAIPQMTRRQLEAGALAGIFLACGYELQTLGLMHTTAAKSAFITGLTVVFVPALMLIPALRPRGTAKPGWVSGLGATLAFTGLVLLTTPAGTRFGELLSAVSLGDLLTLGCALAFAAHLLTLAHRAGGVPAGLLATVQIATCAGVMLLALTLEPMRLVATPRLLLALAICSVLATAAAFTIQTYAQQHLPPTQVVLLLTLEPVFAWITSLLLLGQGFDRRAFAGAALILAGILTIELAQEHSGGPIPEIPA